MPINFAEARRRWRERQKNKYKNMWQFMIRKADSILPSSQSGRRTARKTDENNTESFVTTPHQ